MKKLLLTLALTLALNGCATTLVHLAGCPLYGGGECKPPRPELVQIAEAIDGEMFDAMTPDPKFAPLEHVSVEGIITSGGVPLPDAVAELRIGDELYGTVRADTSGRYQLHGVLEPQKCPALRVVLRYPDERTAEMVLIECGEHRLDYDVVSGG